MLEMEYVKQCLAQYVVETRKHEMESQQGGEHTASGDFSFKFDCQRRMICDMSRYAKTQGAFERMRDEFEKIVREIEEPQMDRVLDIPIIEVTKESLEKIREQLKSALED